MNATWKQVKSGFNVYVFPEDGGKVKIACVNKEEDAKALVKAIQLENVDMNRLNMRIAYKRMKMLPNRVLSIADLYTLRFNPAH